MIVVVLWCKNGHCNHVSTHARDSICSYQASVVHKSEQLGSDERRIVSENSEVKSSEKTGITF